MKKRKIIFILAAIVLVAGVFTTLGFLQSPQAAFKRLVTQPIPNSVQALEERHFLTTDSSFWVLHFKIDKADLQTLIESLHFAPVSESEEFKRWDQNSKNYVKVQKEDYLNDWKSRIQNTTKLEVDFKTAWQVFVLKEGKGTKFLFFDTNSTEAVFVADAH